ncbi:SDR family NAD(P)-dependent oxidoreductase [Devosia sp. A369]
MQTQDTVAIISGGTSGLGAATAIALAAQGARVGILDFNQAGAEAIARQIGGVARKVDVTDAASVETAMAEIAAELGGPRILVNCAGIAPGKRILGRSGIMPLDDFSQVIAVNLIGSFNVMRVFAGLAAELEPLADGERGVIINTASVAAYEGQIGQAAYAASKGGIVSLTLPAARELADRGIRVMAIAPGIFETPMLAAMTDEVRAGLAAAVPFPRRLGTAAEYASLALHIIGNVMLNGTVLRLDGALRMQPK